MKYIDLKHIPISQYVTHAIFILKISVALVALACAGIIHAVIPWVLPNTVSQGIKKLMSKMPE